MWLIRELDPATKRDKRELHGHQRALCLAKSELVPKNIICFPKFRAHFISLPASTLLETINP